MRFVLLKKLVGLIRYLKNKNFTSLYRRVGETFQNFIFYILKKLSQNVANILILLNILDSLLIYYKALLFKLLTLFFSLPSI